MKFPFFIMIFLTIRGIWGPLFPIGSIIAQEDIQKASSSVPELVIEFYTLPGCHDCEEYENRELKNIVSLLTQAGVSVHVIRRNVLDPTDFVFLMETLQRTAQEYRGTPILVVHDMVFQGKNLDVDTVVRRLSDFALKEGFVYETSSVSMQPFSVEIPSLLMVVMAGLLDGINPCAMTVLAFLVSALALSGPHRTAALSIGCGFTLGVFVTYTVTGLGLFHTIQLALTVGIFSSLIRWVTVGVLFILAILSIWDGVKARGENMEGIILHLPRGFTRIIHGIIRKEKTLSRRFFLVQCGISFFVGALVSLLEFVCTGQVYIPTIVYIARIRPMQGLGLILGYNGAFIIPLLLVFLLVYAGLSHRGLVSCIQKNVRTVKLSTGTFFIVLALYIILSR
ncbi:MAG: hypothetical protein N2Z76_03585 [Treponemataceae bacterium]|nr:hypothetical protein [Treponemataceae bacterium]